LRASEAAVSVGCGPLVGSVRTLELEHHSCMSTTLEKFNSNCMLSRFQSPVSSPSPHPMKTVVVHDMYIVHIDIAAIIGGSKERVFASLPHIQNSSPATGEVVGTVPTRPCATDRAEIHLMDRSRCGRLSVQVGHFTALGEVMLLLHEASLLQSGLGWRRCTAAPVEATIVHVVLLRLAVVRPGVKVTVVVVEVKSVWTGWVGADVQEAVAMVVAVGLVVDSAAEPPRGPIGCPPCRLLWCGRLHGISLAASASVLWASNVNDPVRSTQRTSGVQEGLPVPAACRGENLHAVGAAVLLRRPSYSQALLALYQGSCGVLTGQVDL